MAISQVATDDIVLNGNSSVAGTTLFNWSAGDKFAVAILMGPNTTISVNGVSTGGANLTFLDCGQGLESISDEHAAQWVGTADGDGSGYITVNLSTTTQYGVAHVVHLQASAGDVQVDSYRGGAQKTTDLSLSWTTTDSNPYIITGTSDRVAEPGVGSGYTQIYKDNPHFSHWFLSQYRQWTTTAVTADVSISNSNTAMVAVAYYDDNTGGGPSVSIPVLAHNYRMRRVSN
jgi:hypothetical protein